MILWITVYCLISLIPYLQGKYSWEHYIWVLLPIQFYGISVGGVTIKPYMLFIMVIILLNYGNISIDQSIIRFVLLFAILQFSVNLLNDSDLQSYLNQVLFLIVVISALVYFSIVWKNQDSLHDVFHAIVDAGFAYCIVCSIAIVLYVLHVDAPGLYADARFSPGFFVKNANMLDGELNNVYRFRGFTGDPNLLSISVIIACVIGCFIYICDGEKRVKCIILNLLSLLIVAFSDSRTGIIVLLCGVFLINIFIGENKKQKKAMVLLAGLILYFAVFKYGIEDVVLNHGRSSLVSSTGRFAIWGKAISVLERNNLFFGIGTARMASNVYLGMYCHNTWLEWICSDGIIFGSAVTLFFMLFGFFYVKRNNKGIITIVTCYYCCLISLITVDDIANVYLLFFVSFLATYCMGADNKDLHKESNNLLEYTPKKCRYFK